MAVRMLGTAVRTLAVSIVALVVWTGVAHAADPATSPPAPIPAPASPSLLPPYAVWESTPVEGVGPVHSLDLAIGDDGLMHLAVAEASGALVYVVGKPGAWVTSTVELSATAHFIDPAIVLDGGGEPHIAYAAVYSSVACEVGPFLGIFHAEQQGADWVVSVVARPEKLNEGNECGIGSIGWGASIAIDGSGQPWVAWEEGYIGPPHSYWSGRIAQRTGAAWQRVPLGTMPLAEDVSEPHLAADPAGNIHAAWGSLDNEAGVDDAYHTVWRGGQAWTSHVGHTHGVGDLAIDPLGRGFIGLTEMIDGGMEWQIAWDLGAGWVRQLIAGGQNEWFWVGAPRVAIGGDGLPATIAVLANPGDVNFHFVWWDGFLWRSESTGLIPTRVSYALAFDGDAPVIAYAQGDAGLLHLARRVPVQIEPRMWLPLLQRP